MTGVAAAVADARRREWSRVLAATVPLTRDLDLAEECTQDAYVQALRTWPATGVPDRPGAWLTTAARRRARDELRHDTALRRRMPPLVTEPAGPGPETGPAGDDRLRLVFTCGHPALSPEARVALTLRLVCGLSTAEVARALLVPEPTVAARLTRATNKIAVARIPYRVPPGDQLAERVGAVLDVVHLIFATGHTAPDGPAPVRPDLTDVAVGLARLLHLLMPADAEVTALLALLLFTDARAATRTSADGRLLLLSEQDRTRWDRALIAEGRALLTDALRRRPPTRYVVQAAIAAAHAEAPSWAATDWAEIVDLYDRLRSLWPDSPVVMLNRAAAIGFRHGPEAGLDALEALGHEPALATYAYLPATRAEFLRQLSRWAEAADAYTEALALTANAAERMSLAARRADVKARAC